ncbi:nucleotidyltransferase family protein [Gallaecimonas pentaromativorans]|uniref:nucleotidyltransferase family protein n=1 Tax=Gallaecimonas pentaromativorans TaxID=584787 RepID=UPI001E3E8367|nr:nucleotidyltransferase family protein [Gallaecimonas pentaromativorans]
MAAKTKGSPMADIRIILAAAGLGRRYQAAGGAGNKLEQTIEGAPLFVKALDNALASGLPVQVVTRPEYVNLHAFCQGRQVPVTKVYSTGLGQSIASGVAASRDADGWLILLADMPAVPSPIIRQVADALSCHDAARPRVKGKPGHPVGFGAKAREGLLALAGDDGAKALLATFKPHFIECNDSGVATDIDLPFR